MGLHNRKGYTTVRAKDRQTGTIHHMAVKQGSAMHERYRSGIERVRKDNRLAMREFRRNMREAKKAIPLEHRAKVNWSSLERGDGFNRAVL